MKFSERSNFSEVTKLVCDKFESRINTALIQISNKTINERISKIGKYELIIQKLVAVYVPEITY